MPPALSTTSYGMEYPFLQFQLPVLAVSPTNFVYPQPTHWQVSVRNRFSASTDQQLKCWSIINAFFSIQMQNIMLNIASCKAL